MTRAWPIDNTATPNNRAWPPVTRSAPKAPQRTGATLAAAGWTEVDPGIKVTSGVGLAMGNGLSNLYINARINNPATVSDLPSNGLRWTTPSKSLIGATRGSNTNDLIAAMMGATSLADPPSADLIIGWFLTNGTVGFGGGLLATAAGGDWQTFALNQTGGVWTRTAGGAAVATTVGNRVQAETSNGALARVARVVAINSSFVELPAASGAAPAGGLTLNDGLNSFGLYTGWATGVGGTANTDVVLGGVELIGEPGLYYERGF